MPSATPPDLFQQIRLGVALEDIDEGTLLRQLPNLNEYGQTLLHEAISHAQPDYALFLLDKGIDVQQADYQGATALHFAAFYRMAAVADRILTQHGNPNAADEHGNTPLWVAVLNARGEYSMVQRLLNAGADPALKNRYGKSPWDFACQIKDEALQRLLSAYRG
jgi:ankyrin repeat protein